MAELAGVVADRFEIDRLAGEGGMGAVYRAWDRHTGQVVALKVLHPHAAEQTERFEREAQTLSELDHPNIVRLVAFGRTPAGQAFLAMEWLEGESLMEHVLRQPLSVGEALHVCALVADALGAAHDRGVIHRDLKPPNVFLVDRSLARVKLLDFGVARSASSQGERLTRTGVLLGTPAFMAPEQVRAAKDVGPPADVYALGCLLFQCLTGRFVFEAKTPMEMAVSALTVMPRSVTSVRADVPVEIDRLVARLLAKRPTDRPENGAAAARELRALRGGQALRAAAVPVGPSATAGRCLILARPPDALDGSAPEVSVVRTVAKAHGGELHVVADGTALILLAAAGPLSGQVAQGARCALALRELAPSFAIALCAEEPGAAEAGLATRAAVALLPHAQPSQIALSEAAARLLGAEFDVERTSIGALLRGPSQLPAAPTPAAAEAPGGVGSLPAAVHPAMVPAAAVPASPVDLSLALGPTVAAGAAAMPTLVGSEVVPPPTVQAAAAPAVQARAAPMVARKPPWLWVGLGLGGMAVLVLVFLAGGWLLSDSGDRDGSEFTLGESDETDAPQAKKRARRSKDWAPGKGSPYADTDTCPGVRCQRLVLKAPDRFEPVDGLAEATRFIRRTHPKAVLTSIAVHELSGPWVDLTQGGQVSYRFLETPKRGSRERTAHATHGAWVLHEDSMPAMEGLPDRFKSGPIKPPKCRLSRALKVALKNGLDRKPDMSVNYLDLATFTGGAAQPVWQFGSTVKGSEVLMARVDGMTCAWVEDPSAKMLGY